MTSLNHTAVKSAARTIRASVHTMPPNHPARYKHFFSRHVAALKPANAREAALANTIAHFAWCLRQAIDIENRSTGAVAAKRDLRLYKEHVRRMIALRIGQLQQLQGKQTPPALAKMGSLFRMPQNGFVFSSKEN